MDSVTVGRVVFSSGAGRPERKDVTARIEHEKASHVCERGKDKRIADLERDGAKLQGLNQQLAERVAELEAENASLRVPEKINPRSLYSRLVGKLMTHWSALYPMAEWRDPDTAAERIADEVAELRKDKARLDWLDSGGVWKMEKRYDTARGAHWPVFFKPCFGWDEHQGDTARESIDAAMRARL